MPVAVQTFVDQYFAFKHRTPEALAAAERIRYVAREDLMKGEVRMAEGTAADPERLRAVKRFLNMAYDSYVHGSYESTMELCDPSRTEFMMRGHRSAEKRAEFIEAAFLKMHEVVVALEMTAAVTGHEAVFNHARETRRRMDTIAPWKCSPPA